MLIFELHQVFVWNFATMKKFISKTYLYILKRKKPIVSRFWKCLRFYYEILKISNPMIQLMVQIFLHICYIRSKFWFSLPLLRFGASFSRFVTFSFALLPIAPFVYNTASKLNHRHYQQQQYCLLLSINTDKEIHIRPQMLAITGRVK